MSSSTTSSSPSSNFQMPHVFVVPPEEEQRDNPPWCCFDADKHPENDNDFFPSPDTPFLDGPYPECRSGNYPPAPLPRRIYAHQPRLRPTLSKKLEKKQHPEAIRIVESKPSRERDVREDSDVIEVVKVKRNRLPVTDPQENAPVKRTRTLRARASQALQSIKNVSKIPHQTHVKELSSPTESMYGTFGRAQGQIRPQQAQTEDFFPPTPPKKGSLSRGSLRSISQIFLPAKSSRAESLFRVAPSVDAHHAAPAANPSSHSYNNNSCPSLSGTSRTFTTNDAPDSPVFPILNTKKKPNTKLSVRDLHRLFSFSSSLTQDSPSSPTATTAPSASACADVSMEEDTYSDAQLVDLDTPERRIASRYHQGIHTYPNHEISPSHRLSNFSFEMRLDSLEFDALSFDLQEFGVSKEEIVLR